MSKNLTRKGLALGAIVALGASLFAGAPAFAGTDSTGVTLAPSAGTTYNSIAGSSFALSTVVNSNLETTSVKAAKLSYLVTNSAAAPLRFSFDGTGAASVGYHVSSADTADHIDYTASADSADYATTATTAKAVVITGRTGNVGQNSSAIDANKLYVQTSTDATENVVVTVQAFIDENGNGKIDASDFQSPARTLTFIPAKNVTATTTITSSTIGTTKFQASVVLGNDINQQNIAAGDLKLQVKKNGTVERFGSVSVSTDSVDLTWDTTDLVIENSYTLITNAITADTYVAQAYYGAVANAVKLGSASNAVAPVNGTLSADSTDTLETVASANVLRATSANHTANATTVRTGYAGAISFKSSVGYLSTDATTELAAGAGVTVKVTLTKSALAAASTFTAGGVTLTATSGPVSFTTLTDADGAIAFTGQGTGAKADSVIVTINVLKKSGGYETASAKSGVNQITWADAAATSVVNTNLIGASGAVLKVAKGGTYTLGYTIVDQFGQPYTAGTYRATLTTTDGTAKFTYNPVSAAGVISQSVTDNVTAAGSYTVTGSLELWSATAAAWGASALPVPSVTVYSNAVAASAVSATAATTAAVATVTKTLANADLRVDSNSQTPKTIGYGTGATVVGTHHTITGTVTDATGATVPGAVVTVSGAGLGFVVNGGSNAVYSVGTATINTNASGYYSVDVYSNAAGKTSVVVTSGAATKSVAIEFSGITALAETNVVSIDVASLSQVGRSVTATVKVVDKFKNPVSGVAVAVSVTGVGSLSAATVTTDKTGAATVQFVAGANDFGDAVITAKYTATDAAETVVSASKTVTVGVTDAQVDVVGKRVTAVASFSKGKTVGFYVDGIKKWSKLSASDADVVLNYNLKAGRHTVTVKISGGFVTTEVIVVK